MGIKESDQTDQILIVKKLFCWGSDSEKLSTILQSLLSKRRSMGDFGAPLHHVIASEVVIPRFGHYLKLALKHTALPGGLVAPPILPNATLLSKYTSGSKNKQDGDG